MADLLSTDDLTPFATIDTDRADAMVADAIAMACLSAPCLADTSGLTAVQLAAAKAILRAAVLRWHEMGAASGAVSSQTAGPFSMAIDTRMQRRALFWPSEVVELQRICPNTSGAFSIDTAAPSPMLFHATFCNWSNGEGWCTCGAIAFDSDFIDGPFF